jgi:hypothetical protein
MPAGPQDPAAPPRGLPQGGGGWTSHPGLLAAGAAGCVASLCTLWTLNGLPFGPGLLWLTPLPLFLAGLGFGTGSALLAALLGTGLVWLLGNGAGAAVFATLFALPVPLLVGAALRGAVLSLPGPLVLLGLWPMLVLCLVALWFASDGGLEPAMRRVVERVLMQLDVTTHEALVTMVVQLNAAVFGLLSAGALAANGSVAQRILARRGLARATVPPLNRLRLPGWYPVLPLLGFANALLLNLGGDAVAVSLALLTLLPPFFLGIAGVHLRASGRPGRVPMLGLFYVLLLVFLQLMAPAMVALGFFDHFRRGRAAST